MPLTAQALKTRARRAYEWARLRRSALSVSPLILLVAVGAVAGTRPALTAAIGAGLLVWGMVSLWIGSGLQRSLMPGVLAGLAPLSLVACASRYGHACTGASCRSLCLTASVAGGCAAGLFIGRWVARQAASVPMAAAATGAALLTGSMSCSCLGLRGIGALTLAFLLTAPLAWALGPKSPHPLEH
jgi:hypothetical protein